MPSEYYHNVYLKKMNHQGENKHNKVVQSKQREFERYLEVTPTSYQILNKEGEPTRISIQSTVGQTREGERTEKIFLGKLEDKWEIGDIVEWQSSNWMILTKEQLSIPSHFKGKVRECNHNLKWNYEGQIFSTPCHVVTNRSDGLSEANQKSNILFDEGIAVLLAIIPSNTTTKTIQRYDRFILRDKAWRVLSIDSVSVEKLLFLRMEEDQINKATDDLIEQIADKVVIEPETGEVQEEGQTYSIEGDSKIVFNQTKQFTALLNNSIATNVTFSIPNNQSALVTIIDKEANPVVVQANNQGITGQLTLTCTFDNQVTVDKVINVVSLWG